jgi:copper chaperone CopZ
VAQANAAGKDVSPLAGRLQNIPGVASVVVDLTESGGGINVRLEPGADEVAVMERVRELLVAYGVRSPNEPKLRLGRQPRHVEGPLPVDVRITPIESGARVEVATKVVRSFRLVAANPTAVAQGLADAWCQVIGKIPLEIVAVASDGNQLTVTASDGVTERSGSGDISAGRVEALARAVGKAIGAIEDPLTSAPMAVNS